MGGMGNSYGGQKRGTKRSGLRRKRAGGGGIFNLCGEHPRGGHG